MLTEITFLLIILELTGYRDEKAKKIYLPKSFFAYKIKGVEKDEKNNAKD
jgi:hypothetical protein